MLTHSRPHHGSRELAALILQHLRRAERSAGASWTTGFRSVLAENAERVQGSEPHGPHGLAERRTHKRLQRDRSTRPRASTGQDVPLPKAMKQNTAPFQSETPQARCLGWSRIFWGGDEQVPAPPTGLVFRVSLSSGRPSAGGCVCHSPDSEPSFAPRGRYPHRGR